MFNTVIKYSNVIRCFKGKYCYQFFLNNDCFLGNMLKEFIDKLEINDNDRS